MEFSVDGRTVNATMAGGSLDTVGPAVLLLHGSGMDRSAWQFQTRYLSAHNVRAIAVDLPGHGRSAGPALDSVELLAAWTHATVDALGLGPTHLIGHSMGALIAIETAATFPDSVSAVSLLGAAASMGVHPELQAAADTDDPRAAALMTAWGHGRAAHVGQHASPGTWALGGSLQLIARTPPGTLGIDLALCDAYDGMLAAAIAVTCPVQLLLGLQDKMTPRKAAQPLVDALTQPTVHDLECGHMMMWEKPHSVRRLLYDFVRAASS